MSADEQVWRTCPGCGQAFAQPNDPGRKRRYHDDACRQRAYRQRSGRTGHESRTRARQEKAREQFREESEAWAREEARRERERQRSERRRGKGGEQPTGDGIPGWVWSNDTDPDRAKRRRTCRLLYQRAAHPNTPEPEARECRKKAESLRIIYGL